MCALDVLGLADTPTGDQGDVYVEFKEQLGLHCRGKRTTLNFRIITMEVSADYIH